jgi:MFS family permease
MVLPLLPIYADQFTVDQAGWQLGLLMASFSAMQFFFAPVWGRISDRIGRRPVLLVGLAGSALFYSLFGIATVCKSLVLLFVSRIGAGIACATIPTAQAYIADTTSLANRPKGMALIGVAFGLGFTFGPLFGFLAVPDRHAQPGPWPGYVAALLSATACVLAWFLLPESRQSDSASEGHRWFDFGSLRASLTIRSVPLLLAAIFVCMFSFAKFETTLSLLIKGEGSISSDPFQFSWGEVCLTYAYIGVLLALIQGGIVRRMAHRVSEGFQAGAGAVVEILGFALVLAAIACGSVVLLMTALAVVVTGYAFMQPNLYSLISRRSDPARQGLVLGAAQSVNSLARILGSAVGIPMLRFQIAMPYYVAVVLMVVGVVLIAGAVRSGRDFATG